MKAQERVLKVLRRVLIAQEIMLKARGMVLRAADRLHDDPERQRGC